MLKKGDTLLLLNVACEIFRTLETGVKKLEGRETTIGGVLEAADLMQKQLHERRDNFDGLYNACQEKATELDLGQLKVARQHQKPKR